MQEHLNSAAELMRQEQVVGITGDNSKELCNSKATEQSQNISEPTLNNGQPWARIETSELAQKYFSKAQEESSRHTAPKPLSKEEIEALALKIQSLNYTEVGVSKCNHLKWNTKNESTEGFMSMRKAAKLLDRNIGRTRLLKFLRDKKYLNNNCYNNQPNPEFIQKGFFIEVEKVSYNRRGKPRMYHVVPLISLTCIVAIWDEVMEAFTQEGIYKADHPEMQFDPIPFDFSGIDWPWKPKKENKVSLNSLKSTTHE